MDNTSLGDRMKSYESVASTKLMTKTPVIVRIDGKAFHSYTKFMQKPSDPRLQECFQYTAQKLCEAIHGTRLAYHQSDEISLFIADWMGLKTQPWFGYKAQKIVSVAASLATMYFNDRARKFDFPLAAFDARCFNVPLHEVQNYFIWRQQDCTRNSISSLAQAHFSHKQLHGKSCDDMQDMLMTQKRINWNDCLTSYKRGICFKKNGTGYWEVDLAIPVFTQDRNYIERLVKQGVL